MEENKIITKSKQRFHRRKNSKSPMNIRLKIRELEEQMIKNHRHSPRIIPTYRRTPSPLKHNTTTQTRQIKGQHPQKHRYQFRPDIKKGEKSPPKIAYEASAHNKMTQSRPIHIFEHAQPNRNYSPKNQILRIKSQQNRHRPISPENSEEDLQKLKKENQKYKEVYNKSVQKMQALEHQLQELRNQYAHERSNWKETCEILEFKAETKKIPLAHIYSYENRNNLLIGVDKIITEQENQNSSLRDHGIHRSSLINLSLLTQMSREP